MIAAGRSPREQSNKMRGTGSMPRDGVDPTWLARTTRTAKTAVGAAFPKIHLDIRSGFRHVSGVAKAWQSGRSNRAGRRSRPAAAPLFHHNHTPIARRICNKTYVHRHPTTSNHRLRNSLFPRSEASCLRVGYCQGIRDINFIFAGPCIDSVFGMAGCFRNLRTGFVPSNLLLASSRHRHFLSPASANFAISH